MSLTMALELVLSASHSPVNPVRQAGSLECQCVFGLEPHLALVRGFSQSAQSAALIVPGFVAA
ncbi:MAG: hypothetical protein K9L82_04365 [Chromatiaceae bacterium]|nr:hypothetical protein [Chromatiaceae bacterium]